MFSFKKHTFNFQKIQFQIKEKENVYFTVVFFLG